MALVGQFEHLGPEFGFSDYLLKDNGPKEGSGLFSPQFHEKLGG